MALIAKRIKVQHFDDLPTVVSHQPRATLRVSVDLLVLSVAALADLQPHPVGRMHVARFLPCSTVLSGSFKNDFAVGPRRVQYPLRLFPVPTRFFRATDSSAQRVIAIGDDGCAIAGLKLAVITAPRVAGGLPRRLLFDQIASPVPAVAGCACGCLFFSQLIQLVVDIAGFVPVAVFFRAVACAVVGVAADVGCALGGDAFLGELAVGVVFPAFVCALAIDFFRSLNQASFGVALVAELGQGAAIGFLVMNLSQLACGVVVVAAVGAVGALDSGDAPDCIVAELGAALGILDAVQALQAAACVPAGLEGVFTLAGKACDELRALAGCVSGQRGFVQAFD